MALGQGNSFGKRSKTVSKILKLLKKLLFSTSNKDWDSTNETWDG